MTISSTLIPWNPEANTRDRRHQQLVAMLLNSLIFQGVLQQNGPDWVINFPGTTNSGGGGGGVSTTVYGSQWLTGAGPPLPRSGKEGDFYLRSTGEVYQKVSPFFGVPPVWVLQAMAIRGPRGDRGLFGPPGGPGVAGQTGPAGAAGSAGGAYSLISTTTLGVNTTTVTFSSITSSYAHLMLRVTGRNTGANVSDNFWVQFNSDTAGNYDYQLLQANSASATAANAVNQTSAPIGDLSGANAPAGHCGAFDSTVFNYTNTSFFKVVVSNGFVSQGTGLTKWFNERWTAHWRSTAAITRLDLFFPSGNQFASGSILTLYGVL